MHEKCRGAGHLADEAHEVVGHEGLLHVARLPIAHGGGGHAEHGLELLLAHAERRADGPDLRGREQVVAPGVLLVDAPRELDLVVDVNHVLAAAIALVVANALDDELLASIGLAHCLARLAQLGSAFRTEHDGSSQWM